MKILLVLIIFLQIGCAELTMYTVNVVSGITTSLITKKLTDKKIDKEKDDECKDCENDKL
mgnify:FL=1|jgi:uncharacterized protein YxeA|tara:strand:- start:6290 stop:6469 length:180 start_codon:yes stop_codon:yes gene_type:complete